MLEGTPDDVIFFGKLSAQAPETLLFWLKYWRWENGSVFLF